MITHLVTPAKAGVPLPLRARSGIPAFAGMTIWGLFLAGCHATPANDTARVAHTRAGNVKLTGRVVDEAQVISPSTEQQLSDRSVALEKSTTDQLVVVTLPSLRGAPIEEVGLALGRGWGVGQRKLDNGVLLIVAPDDHKVRIEVGYGLEGLLSDDRAGKIVRDMLPLFKANQIERGIRLGESEIIEILESDKRRPQYYKKAA